MTNLKQLKLQGVFLGTKALSDDLLTGIKVHSSRLELLDLKDT